MLKIILAAVAIIIIALIIIISRQPDTFHLSRSTKIAALPEAIFPHVNELKKWSAWSPFEKMDPEMKKTFAGPDSGVGSSMAWVGNSQAGEGAMTITESKPSELVKFRLDFKKPMESTSNAHFTFKPEGDQTVVTWEMDGANSFMSKTFQLFMDLDKMVGGQFDDGLAKLKSVVEAK